MGIYDEVLADLLPEMDADLADAVESFSFERRMDGGWDNLNDRPLNPVVTTFEGRCFFLNFTTLERQSLEIKQGDVKIIIPDNYAHPLISEEITINGLKYFVVNKIDAPTSVIHTYQLRRVGA